MGTAVGVAGSSRGRIGKTIVGEPWSFVPPVAAPWAIAESENAARHRMIIENKAAIGMLRFLTHLNAISTIGFVLQKIENRTSGRRQAPF